MEPDINTIISQKIRKAERNPETWDKDMIWAKIAEQTTPRNANSILHYAAAALFSILLSTSIFMLTQQKQPENKTSKLEKIEEVRREQNTSSNAQPGQQKNTQGFDDHKESKNRTQVKNKSLDTTILISSASDRPIATDDPNMEIIDYKIFISDGIIYEESAAVQPRTIEPIIGIYTSENHDSIVIKTKRKNRWHKLEAVPRPEDHPLNNTIIIARIAK